MQTRYILVSCFYLLFSGSLPDFSMISVITGSSTTHVNETVADTTIQSFLTNKGTAVNRNAPTQLSGL